MNTSPQKRVLYVANADFAFLLGRLHMARAAKAAGFEVHVATQTSGLGPEIEAEGFTLHPIPFRRGGLSPISGVRTTLALRRVARHVRPHIVHCSSLQSCVFGSLAMLGRGIAQVNAITGLGYIFTSNTFRSRLLRIVVVPLLPALLNRKTSVVVVENPDDERDLAELGVDERRIIHIAGSGVDTDRFRPLPEPARPVTYGFVGRLLTDKGIRALVSAHKILRDQGYDFRLLIAGKPDPANPASVRLEEIKEWSTQPGITWLGQIDDVGELWKQCHFAVLPSHREGLPVSLLEAAACGRAMIATNAPGCREIVIQDETGLLVPIENPQALANAILRLASSPELRARYGLAARELVLRRHSARVIGPSIVRLYERILPSVPR